MKHYQMGYSSTVFFSSVVLLVCMFTIGTLGCTFTTTLDSTLLGDNMANGIYGLTAQQCADKCCNTQDCAAATWVSNGGSCWLKSVAMASVQAVSKEVGTSILRLQKTSGTYYECASTVQSGVTIYGSSLSGSGTVFGTAKECFSACCNMNDCKASVWIRGWGACYFKPSSVVAAEPQVASSDTELWIVNSKYQSVAPPNPSCKRGLAYSWKNTNDFTALAGGISWYYEWYPFPSTASINSKYTSSSISNGVEFVPMIWGEGDMNNLNSIPLGTKYLLGFNEPNFGTQSNLTPERAAYLWRQIQTVADQKNIKLVSPAVNYCGGNCIETDPIVWLDKFFAACQGCRVDFIGVHTYVCQVDYLKMHIGMYKKYGKKIWLTEFSCGDEGPQPLSVQTQYLTNALAYLDSDPDVFRYAWFSGRSTEIPTTDLFTSQSGVLNSLGNLYKSNYVCPTKLSLLESDTMTTTSRSSNVMIGAALFGGMIFIGIIVVVVFVCIKKKKRVETV